MNKTEYICKIDGKQFTSKESLMKYMEETYVKEIEVESGLKEKEEMLRKVFPECRIHIEKQEGEIFVSLSLDGVEGAVQFVVTKEEKESWNAEYISFRTIEEAISSFDSFFQKVELVIGTVYFKIKEYEPNVKEVRLKSFYHSNQITGDACEVVPVAIFEDREIELSIIQFSEEDYKDQDAFDEIMKTHVRSINSDYVTEIEGEVKRITSGDYYTSDWYEINGINLNTLAHRAKRLYVKIIEEK